jgi:Flp pilus assembly protein TadB
VNFLPWVLLASAGLCTALLVWSLQRAVFYAIKQHKATYTDEAAHRLSDLFFFVDAAMLWPCACGLAGLAGIGAWLLGAGGVFAFFLAVGCLFVPKLLLRLALEHRQVQFERQLPDALFALSSAMRSGSSLAVALQSLPQHALAPLSQEFAVVNDRIRLGVAPQDAIQELVIRLPGEALNMLAATVRVAIRTGGPMAQMLEQTGKTLLANQQIALKLSSLMAQGWMQAWVMGAMPPGLMLVMSSMDEAFTPTLFSTTEGHMVILMIIVLESLGLWWLKAIARSVKNT